MGAPGEVACVPRWWVTRKQLLMPLQGIGSKEFEVQRVTGSVRARGSGKRGSIGAGYTSGAYRSEDLWCLARPWEVIHVVPHH